MDRLRGFLRETYRLEPAALTPAERGFYGETWRLDTTDSRLFVKLDASPHRDVYRRSFHVVEHLRCHGIDFISRIVKTADGALCADFDGAVLGVFDWIDGAHIENDDTKFPEYDMLARVYAVPGEGLFIPREDFSGRSAGIFFGQWERLKRMPARPDAALLPELLGRHRGELTRRARRLELFAGRCAGDTASFFVTHGDAGGNLIQNGDKSYLVDWDEAMLAPSERDAWVMCPCDWAREAFQNALRRHGVGYALRPERLAYYCYYMFFFYLTAFMDEYLGGSNQADTVGEIKRYFEGFIEERVRYADTIV